MKARAKEEKTQILSEHCRNTAQARKYGVAKIQPGVHLRPRQRKKGRSIRLREFRELKLSEEVVFNSKWISSGAN